MKEQALKTWETKGPYSTTKIEYYEDRVIRNSYNNPIEYSLPQTFTLPSVLSDKSSVDTEILQYIAEDYSRENEEILTEKEQRHFRFWKHLNLAELREMTCKAVTKYGFAPFLDLSKNGVYSGYFKDKNIIRMQEYRLDNLFFYGPKLAAITLEDRKSIQQVFLDALGTDSGFSIKDAFELFDYNKIEEQKWKHWHNPNSRSGSGEFVELYPDRFTIGGWSNPRDGGAQDFSIEEIWYKKPKHVHDKFGANETINKILRDAIIEK
jgi:hypothetical protein